MTEKPTDSRTVFQKILDGDIPAERVHEDSQCIAINDVSPQAPVHLLVIPKKAIPTLNDLDDEDEPLVGHLFLVAQRLMKARGIEDYRTVFNCGALAGQSVFHLHLHVLAGRPLRWPPG